jgi:hypothetical protein
MRFRLGKVTGVRSEEHRLHMLEVLQSPRTHIRLPVLHQLHRCVVSRLRHRRNRHEQAHIRRRKLN